MSIQKKAMVPAALASAVLLAACGGDDDSGGVGGETGGSFSIGMATGGFGIGWDDAQGQVAKQLAEDRGWEYKELSNEGKGPTFQQNVDQFIQDDVDAIITFNGDPSVNQAVAEKAKIPIITYDIGQDGWYFVGVDNQKAGDQGGQALGQLAQDEWNCQVDLVLAAEGRDAGIVNEWRTGGMIDGLKKVCPDIADDQIVKYESGGLVEESQPKARDELAAHPKAENILVVGINDGAVTGAIQAAEQLGRDQNIMGWGQGGDLIGTPDANPKLMGSVQYFLEGYPTYTFTEILDKLAAGKEVDVKDTVEDPTVKVEPCPVTAAQASEMPAMDDRISELFDADEGAHMPDLFCPGS